MSFVTQATASGGALVIPIAEPSGLTGNPGPASTVSGPQGIQGRPGPPGSPSTQTYQAVFDADYTALAIFEQVGFRTLTVQRTCYFPDVYLYPFNQDFVLTDESGQRSFDRPIVLAPGPNTGDQIGDGTPLATTGRMQRLRFRRGAANLWILV